jgi:hypothetical protein
VVRFRAYVRGSESYSRVRGCGEVSKTGDSGDRNKFVIVKLDCHPERSRNFAQQSLDAVEGFLSGLKREWSAGYFQNESVERIP